jgi:glycosyltransferase involved in cell wall biosynthesis
MSKPFFSIVIPTRGRTQVVDWAIRSALAQTFTDLECVVIDNNLDDRVEKICAQFADSRLRRVKTGGLNMPDNLDEAYRNARGTYVILIEDRQCLYHHTLSFVHDLAQREELDCLLWNNDVFEDGTEGSRIRRFGRDRTVKRVRTDDVLEGFCGRNPSQDPMQFILAHRCAVKVSLLEQIRAQTGLQICEPCSPDGTAGLKIMNVLDSYHYFNGSLSVSHSDQLSNGANYHRNKSSTDEFWKSIGGKETAYAHTPIKSCFNENTSFNDYLRLTKVLGGRLQGHALDMIYYYTKLGIVLLKAMEEGHDRKEELAAWQTALAKEPVSVRNVVKNNLRNRNRRRLLQQLRIRLGIRAVERMIRKKKSPRQRYEEARSTVPDFVETESLVLAGRDLAHGQSTTAFRS